MTPEQFPDAVLIVDDEPFVLRITEQVFRRVGFTHVLTAESVAAAIEAMTDANPAVRLVLTDLNMPDTDGLALLRRLHDMQYNGYILLFSGEDEQTLKMAESLARARNLKVLGSISKPIHPDKLVDLLSEYAELTHTGSKSQARVDISPLMLEQAIDNKQIKPWFQPKISIQDRLPVGVEALARWPSSNQGPIFPGDFIPLAEQLGLIDRLTFSIIEQAMAMESQWLAQGKALKVAVNLAMHSLYDERFPDRLEKTVKNANGNIESLQLEVTESQLMEDLVRPLETLLRLRMKKIKLSIDDFGTGHSNLNQLRDLPFDELKLDRSYIHSNQNAGRTAVILESSVEMARKLNMSTVAEGVETLDEWTLVENLGCDMVQGYFCARPMPGDEIPAWVDRWPEIRASLFT